MYQVWMNDRYKLIHTIEDENYELYDIQNDSFENHNVYQQKTVVASDFKKELDEWVERLD